MTTKTRSSLHGEELLSVAEAVDHVPAHNHDGSRLNPATITRWIVTGIRGVRLEAATAGRRWVTSREALERFFHRVAEAKREDTQTVQTRKGGCP